MTYTIGLVLKPDSPGAIKAALQVLDAYPQLEFLSEAQGYHAVQHVPADRVRRVDAQTFEAKSDLIIVFGGDGTFIHAASLLPNKETPILGVNLGTIGFLTEVTTDEILKVLELALQGALETSPRMRLDVEIHRDGTILFQKRILNDMVLSRRPVSRLTHFRVKMNHLVVNRIRGDGVIISTPTGSTAYAMAAGGSILSPELEAIGITPICPYHLAQRPLVFKPQGNLIVSVEGEDEVYSSCDGQAGHSVRPGDLVQIRAAPVSTQVLKIPWRSYFEMLRTKLSWGEG
jgi:NAD+ kinase